MCPTLHGYRVFHQLDEQSCRQIIAMSISSCSRTRTGISVCFSITNFRIRRNHYCEKHARHRFHVGVVWLCLTLLTLLPTSALAASGSGTGIKAYNWTPISGLTRLTSTGQSVLLPPAHGSRQAALLHGSRLFLPVWDSQFSELATPTKAPPERTVTPCGMPLLQDTGLGEMDAITRENVKWMMTYITDYKGDIPGSLFMALQTYIWDHQSNKSAGGDTSGDIDAGGYANADTYETYLGYVNWLLAQKAKEDAEYQRANREITPPQGISRLRLWKTKTQSGQSTRNPACQGPPELFSTIMRPANCKSCETPAPEEPDHPPAGDADITLKKVAAGTHTVV